MRILAGAIALSAWLSERPAAAQFRPQGRVKQPAPKASPPKPQPRPRARPSDPGELIDRYRSVLAKDPSAQFPLQRLVELIRKRDGSLDGLIAELETQVAAGGAPARNARIVLAGVYRHAGKPEQAEQLYRRALEDGSPGLGVRERLAELLAVRGQLNAARQQLDRALQDTSLQPPERERVLRQLIDWSLDEQDLEAAKGYHERLVQLAQGSFFVRAELASKLLQRNLLEAAEAEYRAVVKVASGDSRTQAPALRDLGRVLLLRSQYPEAKQTLERALAAAGTQSGLKREIFLLLVQAHRALDSLPELVERLERQAGSFDHWLLLAKLYEEVGRMKDAQNAYSRAVQLDPRSVEARLSLVQLLELSGDLKAVVAQRQTLVRHSPENAQFVFRLAQAYVQIGKPEKAIAELHALERRAQGKDATLTALVDFYDQLGEPDQALALLERLAQGGNVRHLVALGDRYFSRGQSKLAQRTWARIAQGKPSADDLHTLGKVYLDHDMPKKALAVLRQAVRLGGQQISHLQSLATALERARSAEKDRDSERAQAYQREAQALWARLLLRAQQESRPHLEREARLHQVTLWGLSNTLPQREASLSRALHATPPDLEAGRLLAEVQLRLRKASAAEATLREILRHEPSDVASRQRLEKALMRQGKREAAIEELQELTRLDPQNAREYFQRMARLASQAYDDQRAIEYARKAVELRPSDAHGHQRLAEMYQARQDDAHAIQELQQALRLDDRLFAAYFQLAELLIRTGKPEQAAQLLRKVVRTSTEEAHVTRAARMSMQLQLGQGSLQSLEQDLIPLALSQPRNPVYRRMLVEIYGALSFPLVSAVGSPDEVARAQARDKLQAIGQRAVKPLLDALGDDRPGQQRIALELLTHLGNASAGPALLAFALGDAEPSLRVQAMLAVGMLRSDALRADLERFIHSEGGGQADPVTVAAVWALTELGAPGSRPTFLELLDHPASTLQVLAALGLSRVGKRADVERLLAAAQSPRHAPLARASAAWAASSLEDGAQALHRAQLLTNLSSDPLATSLTLAALVRAGDERAPVQLARALVQSDPSSSQLALRVSCLAPADAPAPTARVVPSQRIDVRSLLEQQLPDSCTPRQQADAVWRLREPLTAALRSALLGTPSQARAALTSWTSNDGHFSWGPFTQAGHVKDTAARQRAQRAMAHISEALDEVIERLAQHHSSEVRRGVLRWLAARANAARPDAASAADTPPTDAGAHHDSVEALRQALQDPDASVQRAALHWLAQHPSPLVARSIAEFVTHSGDWALRLSAVQSLSTSYAASQQKPPEVVGRALSEVALHDPYALVRREAADALFRIAAPGAERVLRKLAAGDTEPDVRSYAQRLLEAPSPNAP